MAYTVEIRVAARDEASAPLDRIRQALGGIGNVAGTVLKGALVGLGAAFGGVTAALGACVREASESERSLAMLDAALRGLGESAPVSRNEILQFAAAAQRTTAFSDEMVIAAETVLLRFREIGRETFPQAAQAALDLAAAMGGEPAQAAQMLGVALASPENALGRLRRMGVVFSAEQEAVIQRLAETGQTAQAQAAILQALEERFGGAAEAAGHTFAGTMERLRNRLSDIEEEIGGALLPALADLGEILIEALGSPAVREAIEAVVDVIRGAAPLFVEFAQVALREVMRAFQALVPILRPIADRLFAALAQVLPPLSRAFLALVQAVAPLVEKILPPLADILGILLEALVPIIEALSPLIELAAQLANLLLSVLAPALQIVAEIISTVLSAAVSALSTALQGIIGAAQAVGDAFGWIGDQISQAFGGPSRAQVEEFARVSQELEAELGFLAGRGDEARGAVERLKQEYLEGRLSAEQYAAAVRSTANEYGFAEAQANALRVVQRFLGLETEEEREAWARGWGEMRRLADETAGAAEQMEGLTAEVDEATASLEELLKPVMDLAGALVGVDEFRRGVAELLSDIQEGSPPSAREIQRLVEQAVESASVMAEMGEAYPEEDARIFMESVRGLHEALAQTPGITDATRRALDEMLTAAISTAEDTVRAIDEAQEEMARTTQAHTANMEDGWKAALTEGVEPYAAGLDGVRERLRTLTSEPWVVRVQFEPPEPPEWLQAGSPKTKLQERLELLSEFLRREPFRVGVQQPVVVVSQPAGTPTVNVQANVASGLDIEALAWRVARELERGGAGRI